MTREIKFRAWDKQNKCWSIGPLYIDEEGRLYEIYERSFAFENYMHKEYVSEEHDVCLYTGLKDKNGVEIYEGDILKIVEPMACSTYGNGCYLGSKSWVNHSKHAVEFTPSGLQLIDYYVRMKISEVIGNIYENPELIKTESE